MLALFFFSFFFFPVLKLVANVWHQNLFIAAARVQTRRNLYVSLRRKNIAYFSFQKFCVRRFSPDKKQNTTFFRATTRQTVILRVNVSTCNGKTNISENVQHYTEEMSVEPAFIERTWGFFVGTSNLKIKDCVLGQVRTAW